MSLNTISIEFRFMNPLITGGGLMNQFESIAEK